MTIRATLGSARRFIKYNVSGTVFEVTDKYKPPFELLGEGGFGIVCSATNSITKERVAIKKISDAFYDTHSAKSALREIKLLRHMDHENIIKIKDVIPPRLRNDFKDVYITYELMATDLKQIIRTKPHYEQCQIYIYKILCGLKYIHSSNVIHRDIKPANILINQEWHPKISDFGLAIAFSDSVCLYPDVGTRPYQAPEMLLYREDYTKAVDVWSLGCTIIELFTHRPIFPSKKSVKQQIHLILKFIGTPREEELEFIEENAKTYIKNILPRYSRKSIRRKFPMVPPLAADLIGKMLVFDPSKRITVVDALAHPYLKSLHDVCVEVDCTTPIELDFEDKSLSKEEIKELVYQEVLAYNPK